MKSLSLTSFCMLALGCFLMFTGLQVYAQDVIIPVVTNDEFISQLFLSLGGLKGATSLAIAGVIVKLILQFASTEMFGKIFKNLSGGVKLTIVLGLSLASGVIALMLSGVPLVTALLHSSTLSAFVVLSNQVYKQYIEKKV